MLRHDLRRTRLMSALFFLLEFIALPLQLALLLFSRPERGFALRTATYAQIYGNLSAVLFPMVIMLSAAVIAMQLMNYNFGRRSVDVYYALPFTRPADDPFPSHRRYPGNFGAHCPQPGYYRRSGSGHQSGCGTGLARQGLPAVDSHGLLRIYQHYAHRHSHGQRCGYRPLCRYAQPGTGSALPGSAGYPGQLCDRLSIPPRCSIAIFSTSTPFPCCSPRSSATAWLV